MAETETDKIRTVRKLTEAGLSACKDALAHANGDVYTAIRELISHEQIVDAWRSLILRKGANIKDPTTKAEKKIIKKLFKDVALPALADGKKSKPRERKDPVPDILAAQSEDYDRIIDGEQPNFFHWVAIDKTDCIALLAARDTSAVPVAVFAVSKKEHMAMFTYFAHLSEHEDDDGLYHYTMDLDDTDGYERIQKPKTPRKLSDCPAEIQTTVASICYPRKFRRTDFLVAKKTWECVRSGR